MIVCVLRFGGNKVISCSTTRLFIFIFFLFQSHISFLESRQSQTQREEGKWLSLTFSVVLLLFLFFLLLLLLLPSIIVNKSLIPLLSPLTLPAIPNFPTSLLPINPKPFYKTQYSMTQMQSLRLYPKLPSGSIPKAPEQNTFGRIPITPGLHLSPNLPGLSTPATPPSNTFLKSSKFWGTMF